MPKSYQCGRWVGFGVHPRQTSMVDHSGPLLFSELFCRTPLSRLKVTHGWGWVGAPFWIFGGWNWEELGWDWVLGDGGLQLPC